MLLAVRILSYGGTWEVWRAFKKLEFLSAAPQATLTLFCALQISRVQTRYTHAKHEQILNFTFADSWMSLSERRPINGFREEAISK